MSPHTTQNPTIVKGILQFQENFKYMKGGWYVTTENLEFFYFHPQNSKNLKLAGNSQHQKVSTWNKP